MKIINIKHFNFFTFFTQKFPTQISKTKNIYLNISLCLEGTPHSLVSNYQRYERYIHNQSVYHSTKNENPKEFNFELSHQLFLQDTANGKTKFASVQLFKNSNKRKDIQSLTTAVDISWAIESNTEYEYKSS